MKLSEYGNHNSTQTLDPVATYEKKKAKSELFNVDRVQRAFAGLDQIVQPAGSYAKWTSYGCKHVVEKQQGAYLSNGDLVAAMLLRGYTATFRENKKLSVNCRFKAKYLV